MATTWHKFKGWFMAITAFIACPCHLPLTLPLLIGLLGGTAAGAWIANNTTLIYGAAGVYFLVGGFLALRWLTSPAPEPARGKKEPIEVILVSSARCASCQQADRLWRDLQARHGFRYRRVDIASGKGHSLAAKHNVLTTPTTIIDGRVAFRDVPDRLRATLAVRR